MTNDARCAGKLAFSFEDRAYGPSELAAQRRHSSSIIRHSSWTS
jgi:hypothetical protein